MLWGESCHRRGHLWIVDTIQPHHYRVRKQYFLFIWNIWTQKDRLCHLFSYQLAPPTGPPGLSSDSLVCLWWDYGEIYLLGSYLLFFGLVSSHMHCLSAPKCGVFVTGCPSVWSFFAAQVGSTRFVMLLFSSLLITVKLPGDGHPQPHVLLPLDLLPAKEHFWFWSCPIGQIRPPSLPVFCFCCHLLGNQLFHLRRAWQLAWNFCSANSVHLIN